MGLQGATLGKMVLALGLAIQAVCILDFVASTVSGQAGGDTPPLSPGGVCHNEKKRENGLIRLQLQQGDDHFGDHIIYAADRRKGITVFEFETGLTVFFGKTKSSISPRLERHFLGAVIRTGIWAREEAYPYGITPSTQKVTNHQEFFPRYLRKNLQYRVDTENKVGKNLTQLY